jgi:hypothetical protein
MKSYLVTLLRQRQQEQRLLASSKSLTTPLVLPASLTLRTQFPNIVNKELLRWHSTPAGPKTAENRLCERRFAGAAVVNDASPYGHKLTN